MVSCVGLWSVGVLFLGVWCVQRCFVGLWRVELCCVGLWCVGMWSPGPWCAGLCSVGMRCAGPCSVGLVFGAVVCEVFACVGGDAVEVHSGNVMGCMGAKSCAGGTEGHYKFLRQSFNFLKVNISC